MPWIIAYGKGEALSAGQVNVDGGSFLVTRATEAEAIAYACQMIRKGYGVRSVSEEGADEPKYRHEDILEVVNARPAYRDVQAASLSVNRGVSLHIILDPPSGLPTLSKATKLTIRLVDGTTRKAHVNGVSGGDAIIQFEDDGSRWRLSARGIDEPPSAFASRLLPSEEWIVRDQIEA